MTRRRKSPKRLVDVPTETTPERPPIVLGCEHGRPPGQACPHCLGIADIRGISGGIVVGETGETRYLAPRS